MERMTEDLPPVSPEVEAFRREGMRLLLETLIEWEPDSVKEEKRLKEAARDAN